MTEGAPPDAVALSLRSALAVLTVSLLVILLGFTRFVPFSSTPSTVDLRLRLDPNVASCEELTLLPGIGPARAANIVDFRQSAVTAPAFRSPEDLDSVRGIGPATIAKLRPLLRFPSSGEPAP